VSREVRGAVRQIQDYVKLAHMVVFHLLETAAVIERLEKLLNLLDREIAKGLRTHGRELESRGIEHRFALEADPFAGTLRSLDPPPASMVGAFDDGPCPPKLRPADRSPQCTAALNRTGDRSPRFSAQPVASIVDGSPCEGCPRSKNGMVDLADAAALQATY